MISLTICSTLFPSPCGDVVLKLSGFRAIRLSDEERKMLDVVAQAHDCKVPSLMKRFALEKVEDEYDISIFEKYEKQDAEGRMKTRPIDAFFAECGL